MATFNPTEYQGIHNGHRYNISEFQNEWTILRWPENRVRIPPFTDIYTNEGWVSVMNCEATTVRFPDAESAFIFIVHLQ